MKKASFFSFLFLSLFCLTSLTFTSCSDDEQEDQGGAPFLEVNPETLQFTSEGGEQSFQINANRYWTASVEDGKDWLTLSANEGEGKANVRAIVSEGGADEAKITIELSNKMGALKSATVTVKRGANAEKELIYQENVGNASLTSPYPYVDKYEGWTKAGAGAANVAYTGTKSTVRASGLPSTDAYEGASGPNVVFLGTAPSDFIINKIALTEAQTNLYLSFGASYSKKDDATGKYDNKFHTDKFHVSLSADGTTWTEVKYDINNGDENHPYWIFAQSNFTLKEAKAELYIKFAADESSAFRIDDITLSTGNGGQVVDLAAGGTTPDPEPGTGEATVITIPELVTLAAKGGIIDATADRYFEAVVQTDVDGGNIVSNELSIATEGATTENNGLILYGSQVNPETVGLKCGDKIKVTLYKGLAEAKNWQGKNEVTGKRDATWCKVEKIGTAAIVPTVITVDQLAAFQGMTVTVKGATPDAEGIWSVADNFSKHAFTVAGQPMAVFVQKNAAAFLNVPFVKTTGDITGIPTVYRNDPQIVPRNADDVKAFNAVTPMITDVDPSELSFLEAGSKELTVTVANQGNNTLSVSGLTAPLSATVEGNKVTVKAEANTTDAAIEQTMTITLTNGNSVDVKVTLAGKGGAGVGYTLVSTVEGLTAGKYVVAGYAEKYEDFNTHQDVILAPYSYQVWDGKMKTSGDKGDLITNPFKFDETSGLLSAKEGTPEAAEIEFVAVEGQTNTYYIKSGAQYLKATGSKTRQLGLADAATGAEWVVSNNPEGNGLYMKNGSLTLVTAQATYNFLRGYGDQTVTDKKFFGVYLFKSK